MRLGVTYFGSRIARHVAADMRELARLGFHYVIHTMPEYDLAFHRGTMRDIVSITHDAGLEAHMDPWGVGNVFGGEPFSRFVEQRAGAPDGLQVLDDGQPAPFACPNSPAFRAFMREWTEAAIETGADVLFWDEPHFHSADFLGGRRGRWGCRCAHCRERFAAAHGGRPMPEVETPEVAAFKEASLREFLGGLLAQGAAAGRRNILYLTANIPPAEARAHWLGFARLPHLEAVSTGPYWLWRGDPVESVGEFARALQALAEETGHAAQLWIQGCKIPRGREKEVRRAVELARAAGIRDLAVWAFEGCACESWIACEDPAAAWREIVEALKSANPG